MTVLAAHIGHRTELLDERRLRCHDCQFTLVLPVVAGSTSTSRSPIPGPGEPRCPQHEHEHATGCRPCAADRKAHPDADHDHGHHEPDRPITTDVQARAAEARAALPPRRPEPRRTPADPERMAQARAELDQMRAQPVDETTTP